MYKISKSFDFCYGHRVYSQNVNTKYSIDDENPCRRIHGHQGNVTVELRALSLDHRGFVIDFKELTFLKKFINDNLDHRFILSFEDPNFSHLAVGHSPEDVKEIAYPIEVLDGVIAGYRAPEIENDSFVFVDFNPTSENLAEWIYSTVECVLNKSPFKCRMESVIWSETPKTQAIFTGYID